MGISKVCAEGKTFACVCYGPMDRLLRGEKREYTAFVTVVLCNVGIVGLCTIRLIFSLSFRT